MRENRGSDPPMSIKKKYDNAPKRGDSHQKAPEALRLDDDAEA